MSNTLITSQLKETLFRRNKKDFLVGIGTGILIITLLIVVLRFVSLPRYAAGFVELEYNTKENNATLGSDSIVLVNNDFPGKNNIELYNKNKRLYLHLLDDTGEQISCVLRIDTLSISSVYGKNTIKIKTKDRRLSFPKSESLENLKGINKLKVSVLIGHSPLINIGKIVTVK